MDLALQRRALKVLGDALGRPAAKREAWVQRSCSDDPELLAAVFKLLRSDAVGAAIIPTEPPDPLPMADRPPPERIGSYRLTRLLGEGGMSKVWLAERDDGLFDHAVAVKLMRPRAFGRVSRELFDEERRILARLKHPNIAQLFDGGVDPDGAPYLVMERLTGAAIDSYVRDHGLSVREIIALALQVCAAVRHAHQNLVVHADIKPSNVLVDHTGVAKLLDFGVAQVLGPAAPQPGAAFPVTAAYASPQRLAGERPTPADDVYSLGALLHDLLAGVSVPQDERGPPSATLLATDGSVAARKRARALTGDLDAIVLKATAPAAEDRYTSVDALGEDLSRWLADRPVRARNPDWRMESSRFARRHPWAMGSAAAAFIGLVIALAVTTSLYLEAHRARLAAEQRFAEVRGMAKYLLFDLYDHLDRTPQSLPLRRDVASQGQAYLARLTADPGAPASVQVEAVDGLVRLAGVQGQPGRANLGEATAARANLAAASRIAGALASGHPDRPDVWLASAKVDIAEAAFSAHADNAIPVAEKALERARAAIARAESLGANADAVQRATIDWRLQLSNLRGWQGRHAESAALARTTLVDISRVRTPNQELRLKEAQAWDHIAEALYYSGDETGAEAPYRKEAAVIEALSRASPSDPVLLRALATVRWALGVTLVTNGKSKDALPILEAGVADAERLVAFDASDQDARRTLRIVQIAQAQALAGLHRFGESIDQFRTLIAERRAIWQAAPDHAEAARDYAISLSAVADVEADAGRKPEACADYARSLAVFDTIRRLGRLTGLDQDYGIAMIKTHRHKVCGL